MINLDKITAQEIAGQLAVNIRTQRKKRKLTQVEMAKKSGVSLASYRRFEQTGLIALQSLINIAIALGCEDEFDGLFSGQHYSSIEEVIAANQ